MTYSDPIPLLQGTSEPTAPQAGQVAALCWRLRKGRAQVLLVTSRDTGRWVLPKGWPMPGLTAEAAAAREAWEEAGVEGKVSSCAIGLYCYDKMVPGATALSCAVQVFPLRVQSLRSNFPERKQRRRKWFASAEAALVVAEPALATLLEHLAEAPEALAPNLMSRRTARQTKVG